jgi:hypothetical protein
LRRFSPAPAALSVLLTLLASPALAAPWTQKPRPPGLGYGGQFFVVSAPDLKMERDEDVWELRTGLDFRVRYKFGDDAEFQLGVLARWDLRYGDRVVGKPIEADLLVDLGESFLQFRKDGFTVRMGRLYLRWGRNLLLSPLDVLTPVDYTRALSSAGIDDAKIPVLAARATLSAQPLALELVFIPFFQPMRIAAVGRDFSALGRRGVDTLTESLAPQSGLGAVDDAMRGLARRLGEELVALDSYRRDGVSSYLMPDLPEETPRFGDLGARIGLTGRGVDFDAYVLWHVMDRPAIDIDDALRRPLLQHRYPDTAELTRLGNPETPLLSASWRRALLGGIDVSAVAGDFVFTAEVAAQSSSVHYRETLEPWWSPQVQSAVSVRFTPRPELAFDVEAQHTLIVRPPADLFFERQNAVQLAAVVSARLLRERLRIALSGSWSVLTGDVYVHPRVEVDVQEGVVATFGVQLFEGRRRGDDFEALLAYTGGALGWFRANDYAYAMVRLTF